MKATGIVRRIDDLGRLVIPKEIRRSLRIHESDPIEIFTERDGEIVLRKYARIHELTEYCAKVVQAINGTFGCQAAITDCEKVLCAAGAHKSQLQVMTLSEACMERIRKKQSVIFEEATPQKPTLFSENVLEISSAILLPILTQGDAVGSILICSESNSEHFGPAELQTLKAFSLYLGKLLEE